VQKEEFSSRIRQPQPGMARRIALGALSNWKAKRPFRKTVFAFGDETIPGAQPYRKLDDGLGTHCRSIPTGNSP